MFSHYGPSVVAIMDIPLIEGDETCPWSPRIAAFQSPWPTAVVVAVLRDNQFFPFKAITTAATMGHLLDDLPIRHPGIIDYGTKFRIEIYGEEKLLSINKEEFLAGSNVICIENSEGWEIIQFMSAEIVAPNTYELSVLLRGQYGTDYCMGSKKGNRFVIWNPTTCSDLNMTQEQVSRDQTIRFGPSSNNPTHYTWTERNIAFKSNGLKPRRPVHVRHAHVEDQLRFSWIRQTRINGDTWEQQEVPLAEEQELYDAELVFSDGLDTVIYEKAFDLPSPNWVTNFHEDANEIRIWQKSMTIGRGWPNITRIR